MIYSNLKVGETYLNPLYPSKMEEITLIEVNSSGYRYTYQHFGKTIIGGVGKMNGSFTPNDNVNLFKDKEQLKSHLKETILVQIDAL